MINRKFEERTCGDGPSLQCVLEDDHHLLELIHSAIVRIQLIYIVIGYYCIRLND